MAPRKPAKVSPIRGRAPDFQLEAEIKAMKVDNLQCRDFGHSWRPYTASWNATERCYETQLRCARCKTMRVRLIGQAGQLLRNNYDYTEGYLIKGMGRLDTADRDVIRLQSVLRVLPEDAANEA